MCIVNITTVQHLAKAMRYSHALFCDAESVPPPEPLPWRLPLWTLAQVADVVEREEEAVPGGSEPGEGEGCVKLLKGQLGQLGGACPGRAHAHHHGDSPQGLLHVYGCYFDAAMQPPPAGARLCPRRARRWLSICSAHHVLPVAVFSCVNAQTLRS